MDSVGRAIKIEELTFSSLHALLTFRTFQLKTPKCGWKAQLIVKRYFI